MMANKDFRSKTRRLQ